MTKSKQAMWVAGIVLGAILLGLLIQSVAEATHYLQEGQKGVAYTFNFSIIDSNSPWQLYGTAPAAEDVYVYQDGVSGARATNAVTDRGLFMELTLTTAEMTAVNWVAVEVNDITSPPLYGDEVFYIPIIIGDPCLASTSTNGIAIDVAATGEVGVDFSNVNGTLDAAEIGGDAITAAKIAADAIGSSEFATSAIDKIEDDSLANNKVKFSLAYWITRVKGGDPVDLYVAETAQGGTTNSITLAATASTEENAYRYMLVELKSGTGSPNTRTIVSYDGVTKIATVGENWDGDSPDATTTYTLWAAPSSVYADEGLAQAGDATTITLAATAPDVDDITGWIKLRSGTGAPDTQEIVDYDGTTKVVTVTGWTGDSPSTDTYYALIPMGSTVSDSSTPSTLTLDDIKAALMGSEYDEYDDPGTFGWLLQILLRKP